MYYLMAMSSQLRLKKEYLVREVNGIVPPRHGEIVSLPNGNGVVIDQVTHTLDGYCWAAFYILRSDDFPLRDWGFRDATPDELRACGIVPEEVEG